MPSSLQAPVLQVDANVIHQVDTSNPQNLFSMWTVFARCKDSVAQGKRLENLSWRLWTRETFCVESTKAAFVSSTSQPRAISRPACQLSDEDMPQLSGSVDSIADEEAVEFSSDPSSGLDIVPPRIRRQDSWTSSRSRGRERHITSDDLEKMVVSIVEQKQFLHAPLPDIPASMSPPKQSQDAQSPHSLQRSGSTSSEDTESTEAVSVSSQPASSPDLLTSKATTVVHGFSPSSHQLPLPATYSKSCSPPEIPAPKSMPAPKVVEPKKGCMFTLGASSEESYSDACHSLEKRSTLAPPRNNKMFQVGGSSEEESSLKSALASPRNPLTTQKKTASFANMVSTRTIPAPAVFDDDDEDSDYLDESAIDDSAIDDDDEGSDWEDSNEESGPHSVDDSNNKIAFSRVDSKVFDQKANLPSRRSLISLMVEQNHRRGNLSNMASQSTSAISHRSRQQSRQPPSLMPSPNDSDDAPLMMKARNRGPPMKQINEIPRSTAQPILTTNGINQQALSPRTTRRNMLSTELTESLRRHLLWERQQKTSTANAVMKRRHTSQDVANLKQYPERAYMSKADNDVNASSWNQEFTREAFSGYHSKGW